MRVFKRKIYSKLLEWKDTASGAKALLVEGARRIGKSTIVEEFAKREYKSYILIDFNKASKTVVSAFHNYLNDLDTFFMILSTEYGSNYTTEGHSSYSMRSRNFLKPGKP